MPKRVGISLANKCQLLFGAAVLLILTAALAVVWTRMQSLVQVQPLERARDAVTLARQQPEAFLSNPVATQAADDDPAIAIRYVPGSSLPLFLESQPQLQPIVDLFNAVPDKHDQIQTAIDDQGRIRHRYLRVFRQAETGPRTPSLPTRSTPANANLITELWVVTLRDDSTPRQTVANRIYIVAAGLLAGLLAIAVFWFITTRLILSPVRLLRTYAQRVADGQTQIRSDINTGDEFQDLSDMFNTMLERLRDRQDQLSAANKTLDLRLGELAESNITLYEANKLKGEFLANVSHELRTPLNSIIGFAEVLQETLADKTGPIDEKRKRYAANIITSSRRLLDLINDLLDLAKIEAGRVELNLQTVSVADTVEGLITLIKPVANKRSIQLDVHVAPKLPAIETDPGKLHQILFNFLSNAVKFTPKHGRVTLAATAIPANDNNSRPRVRLAVTDTGPGIHPEDHDKVFEKFSQLDPSVTKAHGGTGLGLTISQELAHMLQAEITLDSEPGQGATFAITLPLVIETRSAPLMPVT
ncbi:MAG: HAMP domain-containing sensor histidine kinase [Planctomycetota bacterium]